VTAAELQKLADAETLHVSSFCESAPASALKRLVSETRLETRIHSLTLVLERLWLFYEAMRSGKPLARGDELLIQMGSALKDATRTKHSSQDEEFASAQRLLFR
jgi:hypothetical protein